LKAVAFALDAPEFLETHYAARYADLRREIKHILSTGRNYRVGRRAERLGRFPRPGPG